jgi:hypothetical protein
MIIDSKKIITETLQAFSNSAAQQKKFSEIVKYVNKNDYQQLHSSFLSPTTIKIDCDQFVKEIEKFSDDFEQWGTQHTHLPRYGLALVNQDGKIKKQDPINGSLYEWNVKYPNDPIIESDCTSTTSVMSLPSLTPLLVLTGHWCRSNILKWHNGADFKPHIDTLVPSPWIRLWGTTDPDSLEIRYDNGNGTLIKVEGIEAGRIYIIDTSLVHDAVCKDSIVYQFFLSVLPSSINILKELKCQY